MKNMRWLGALCLVVVMGLSGCGYTRKTVLPRNMKTIYVETVKNKLNAENIYAYQQGLEMDITNAVIQRLQQDGTMKVVEQGKADAILKTDLISLEQEGLRFNSLEGVSQYRLFIVVRLRLVDSKTGDLIWEEPNFSGDTEYYVTTVTSIGSQKAAVDSVHRLAYNIADRVVEDWCAVPLPSSMKSDLFLIVGDPFLREQKTKILTAEIEKKAGSPLAHQTFDLEETPLETVLAAARTLQFFLPGQVLCVQNAGSMKEPEIAAMEAYLEHPEPKTTLVLESDGLKGATDLQKLVKAKGQLILLAKEEARGSGAAFIQQKLAQYQKTMAPAARTKVLAMCGDAVMFLDTMIERLVQFSGDQKEIDEDMVSRFEENWTEMDVFKLTNALVDRDPARALKVFRNLVGFYEADLISLVGILHWQLRQLWQASMLLAAGVSEREICSKLRMPPQRLSALRRFPVERMEAAIESLYHIDRQSKTGQVEGVAGVEAWLLEYAA